MELLGAYVRQGSEEAFAALVTRHVNLVYSAAVRKTGNPHAAEEITQAVFVILAKKAEKLRKETILSGWLYQTARLTASSFLRNEIRRTRREQEAYMLSLSPETEPEFWREITPLLEDAMGALGEKDRDAIVLRFFEEKSFQEIGLAFGATENAAKKRVAYGLEKLRRYFLKRGVVATVTVIAAVLSANSVQAAPLGLAKTAAAAVLKGASASGSTSTLIKGALKLMAWTKAKTEVVAGVVVLLAASTATVGYKEIQEHRTYAWQLGNLDTRILDRERPQVMILPTKSPRSSGWGSSNGKIMGLGTSGKIVVQAAYAPTYGTKHLTRILTRTELPPGRFDFIASLPEGNAEALQAEIRRKFHLVAKLEKQETEVLLLTVKRPNAPGLRSGSNRGGKSSFRPGRFSFTGTPMNMLTMNLEEYLQVPVLDRTGLDGNYDMQITWDEPRNGGNPEGLKEALENELGLELVPSREVIDALVVEKAR